MPVIVTIAITEHAEGHDNNAQPRQRRGSNSLWRRRPVPAMPERSEGKLSGQPEFNPGGEVGAADQPWTEGPLDDSGNQLIQQYLITNTSPQFTPASLSASCVWTPVTGYGGGSGPP